MPAIQPSAADRAAAVGSRYVVMVGDEPCLVRATGVRPIADVLAPPEAELLAWEEMAAVGAVERGTEGDAGSSGGMIAAFRARRRRDRPTASRATLLGRSHG
ncbi:MAG: hypothetical protein ACKO5R_05650 [Planctomycetaceae bacterium]